MEHTDIKLLQLQLQSTCGMVHTTAEGMRCGAERIELPICIEAPAPYGQTYLRVTLQWRGEES